MCLGFVFSWPVGWHVLCSGGLLCTDYSVQGLHFRVGTSIPVCIYLILFIQVANIEIASSTCGCLVSRRCPSQWMSYGAGHEKSFNRTTLSCQTSICDWVPSKFFQKALASWEYGVKNQVYLQQNESCYQWTLLWCRQLMRVARCVFSCQPFPERGVGGHKQPDLHSNSLVESDLPSNRLPQTNSNNSENWCFGRRKLYNLDCWWTASFLCTVHFRDDYIILDLSPQVSENGTSSSIHWNTNRAPSCQQIRPIALLAADAENAADAVQARHMIDLDESCSEVENMS